MSSDKINWGIIGCGNVTEVKSGPAFTKVPASELVAVMRRDGAKAKDYAHRHKVEKWYNDAAALINDAEVNAIYIATPPLYHEEYAIQALQAGKPVYVEKPMALTSAASKRIAAVAKETGVKICVAHYRRQQPLFLKIKSLLQEKFIGDVRLVNLQCLQPHNSSQIAKTEEAWRTNAAISGGGLFHDLAPHQLDLMLYFFGKPIKAKGFSLNASGLYDADDTVSGQLMFEKNILFSGTWCFTSIVKRDACEIIGTEGTIRFSIFDHQAVIVTKGEEEMKYEFDPLPHVQQPMIEKVVQYFLGHASNPCPAEDGITVMEMIEAFTTPS